MKKFTITTPHDALILGLTLAITAPTKGQFVRATHLANSFARGMTPTEIENAKSAAQSLAGEWAHEQSHTAPSRN
jgi:hypothetical protein